ncbi:hypothetical protein [Nocardia australiensis]|uniref:hypothetical protein n=1 Tax=Nocardia australiensis TaxID=2887191 RepID=UPI001D13E6F7|nr:hypothetical protein [Nocardia australiensis]
MRDVARHIGRRRIPSGQFVSESVPQAAKKAADLARMDPTDPNDSRVLAAAQTIHRLYRAT